MDLREKKTKRSIYNAFMELRAKKPLERITIKELTELAEISKATFYLHYKDIYDLSDQLQKKTIEDILSSISDLECIYTTPPQFTFELFHAFIKYQHLIEILFSGSQMTILPMSIEKAIKKVYFTIRPEMEHNATANIYLTYQIMGGYYAFEANRKKFGDEFVIDVIDGLTRKITGNIEDSNVNKEN
uniref:TetR/AcrR family transcriptional regulator n=1 Tax=Agathobacter sp. TaxID=2021311 RepID=UPI004056CABC